MARRKKQRWVVKLGTGILSHSDGTLDLMQIQALLSQVIELKHRGYEMIIVSSGAVGAGMGIMKLKKRPTELRQTQACAAIGQPQLMRIYERVLSLDNYHAAQILLTYFDLDSRRLYRNAQATIEHLLEQERYIPVINENDVVSYEELELKFGDNDQLSAHVATMVNADRLIILSNVRGLTRNPDGTGRVIAEVPKITPRIEKLAGASGSQLSVGGMVSKFKAAKVVTSCGITMQIADGREPEVLLRIADGNKLGTVFLPENSTTAREPLPPR